MSHLSFYIVAPSPIESGPPLLALELGVTIEKEHAVPRGPEGKP